MLEGCLLQGLLFPPQPSLAGSRPFFWSVHRLYDWRAGGGRVNGCSFSLHVKLYFWCALEWRILLSLLGAASWSTPWTRPLRGAILCSVAASGVRVPGLAPACSCVGWECGTDPQCSYLGRLWVDKVNLGFLSLLRLTPQADPLSQLFLVLPLLSVQCFMS